jgi:hypothetical protein
MPWPTKDESKDHYMIRAIPEIMADSGVGKDKAVAQALGMWKQSQPAKKKKVYEGININHAYPVEIGVRDGPEIRDYDFETETARYKIYLTLEYIYHRDNSPVYLEVQFGVIKEDGTFSYERRNASIKEMYRVFATVFKVILENLNENPLILAVVFDAGKEEDKKGSRRRSYRTITAQLAKYLDWNYAISSSNPDSEDYYIVCPQMSEDAIEEMLNDHDVSFVDDPSLLSSLTSRLKESGKNTFLNPEDPKFMKLFYKHYLADSRYSLKDVKGFPRGVDLENCSIIHIGKESIQFEGGGDWQNPVSFSFGVVNSQPEIIDIYDSFSKKTPKRDVNEYLDRVKALNGEFKESISKKYYWKNGGPTRHQNKPGTFDDVNSHRAGMALDKGFDLNKREVAYSGPVVGAALRENKEVGMRKDYGELFQKMKQDKDPDGLNDFFNSLEEDMGGVVGLSSNFQNATPEHMLSMNGVPSSSHNKGTGNTKHGKIEDHSWDSAYTRTRSEDYLRVRENTEALEEERAVRTIAFQFPRDLKGVSDIHFPSQIQGVLNSFGRGVVLTNGEVRVGATGSSHVGLLQGESGERFYWGYRAGTPGIVYVVGKNGRGEDIFREPETLKKILSQVFNLLRLGVAAGGLRIAN